MKTIIQYLKDHIKNDYHPLSYGITAVFLISAFIINYSLDFEDKYLGKAYGKAIGYLYFFLYYAFAYYIIAVPKLLISKNYSALKSSEFWLKSSVFIALIGIAGAYYYYDFIINCFSEAGEIFFVKKLLI
ncbi:MAG: hypothetical protein ABIJ97_01985, partial [Bacteroidota bacterium]